MNIVEQGRTYSFNFELEGTDADAFTVTMRVMQYPQDTPAINRNISYTTDPVSGEEGYIVTLTAAETASLAVGEWWVHMNAIDSDENLGEPVKLYISKGWV